MAEPMDATDTAPQPDFSIWTAGDDLLLKESMEAGARFEELAESSAAALFSRKFTHDELRSRWHALLFNPAAAGTATTRMKETLAARPAPVPFKDIYNKDRREREAHAASDDEMPSFASIEMAVLALDPMRTTTDRRALVDSRRRRRRQAYRLMRLEYSNYAALARMAERSGALAILSGHKARFLMKKEEVSVGRATSGQAVDMDLSAEGNASKVSRQQALIQLRRDGTFSLKNIGRRNVHVNNHVVEQGQRCKLSAGCLVDVGGLRFVFYINYRAVHEMVHSAAFLSACL